MLGRILGISQFKLQTKLKLSSPLRYYSCVQEASVAALTSPHCRTFQPGAGQSGHRHWQSEQQVQPGQEERRWEKVDNRSHGSLSHCHISSSPPKSPPPFSKAESRFEREQRIKVGSLDSFTPGGTLQREKSLSPPPGVSAAQQRSDRERFRVEPGRIENYTIGKGSLAQQESYKVSLTVHLSEQDLVMTWVMAHCRLTWPTAAVEDLRLVE